MFNKKTKSITCIKTTHKLNINNKEIEQIQYFTENYVYTEAGDKKIMYLPEKRSSKKDKKQGFDFKSGIITSILLNKKEDL